MRGVWQAGRDKPNMRRLKYFAVDIEKTAFAPYLIGIAKMLVSQTSVA
jgi:hypothetical protein